MVLAQPFFWMWLYSTKRVKMIEGAKSVITFIGLYLIQYVFINQTTIGYYTPNILIQYIILTLTMIWLYGTRFTAQQAISLAFLTVYLNSIYWEFPYHMAELIQLSFYPQQLNQLLRLTPAIFFVTKFTFTRQSLKPIGYGYGVAVVSMLLVGSRIMPWTMTIPVHAVTRLVCVWFLAKTIMEATPSQAETE